MNLQKKTVSLFKKVFQLLLVLSYMSSFMIMPNVNAQSSSYDLPLPAPGTLISPSNKFSPVIIKGLRLYPHDPLKVNFLIEPGDEGFVDDDFHVRSKKLINYFLASLTIPKEELWVNLSPYEKDRIVTESFGKTEMGKDMLMQDYMLKQLTASLSYPEDDRGKQFWNRVYSLALEKFGTTEIPLNTFNKIWIVPEQAEVFEHEKGVMIINSYLKVMLEEDYLALNQNTNAITNKPVNEEIVSGVSSQVVKEILIPEIEREVNEGEVFVELRQIFNSLILATWYKETLKESFLGKYYADQNKIKGFDLKDNQVAEKVYDQYVQSFKKGVYDYISEEYDPKSREIINRKYFSGGVAANQVGYRKAKESDVAIVTSLQAKGLRSVITELSRYGDQQNSTEAFEDMALLTESSSVEDVRSYLTSQDDDVRVLALKLLLEKGSRQDISQLLSMLWDDNVAAVLPEVGKCLVTFATTDEDKQIVINEVLKFLFTFNPEVNADTRRLVFTKILMFLNASRDTVEGYFKSQSERLDSLISKGDFIKARRSIEVFKSLLNDHQDFLSLYSLEDFVQDSLAVEVLNQKLIEKFFIAQEKREEQMDFINEEYTSFPYFDLTRLGPFQGFVEAMVVPWSQEQKAVGTFVENQINRTNLEIYKSNLELMKLNPFMVAYGSHFDKLIDETRRRIKVIDYKKSIEGKTPLFYTPEEYYEERVKVPGLFRLERVKSMPGQTINKDLPPKLVITPYSGHDGKGLADYPNANQTDANSLVQTYKKQGFDVYVLIWENAEKMQDIGDLLEAVHQSIITIGKKVSIAGLCHGGAVGAIYASIKPENVAGLIVAGSPIRATHGENDITRYAAKGLETPAWMQFGQGKRGIYEGLAQIFAFHYAGYEGGKYKREPAEEELLENIDNVAYMARKRIFDLWFNHPVDLGYLVDWIKNIFIDDAFFNGTLKVRLGDKEYIADPRNIPEDILVASIEGKKDDITPPPIIKIEEIGTWVQDPVGLWKFLTTGIVSRNLFQGIQSEGENVYDYLLSEGYIENAQTYPYLLRTVKKLLKG